MRIIILISILIIINCYLTNNQKKFLKISSKYVYKYPILNKIKHKLLYNGYKPWAIKIMNNIIMENELYINEIRYIEIKLYSLLGLEYAVRTYKEWDPKNFKKYSKKIISEYIENGLKNK
uniref:Uncharacterized protein n=1 Tax=viral metagenome TaxID=1070528 RepID=A0A6C0H5T2_9ZZZZ